MRASPQKEFFFSAIVMCCLYVKLIVAIHYLRVLCILQTPRDVKLFFKIFIGDRMPQKINWIDNLRGIACLMVVMIHTTTWYITNAHSVTSFSWELSNVLNSASRVSVPLFFMISGYLFFGERSARPRHLVRIGLCLLFYSVIALIYIHFFTSISAGLSLRYILQKPVFYHLWFFFAIIVVYLLSPLIQVKKTNATMILGLMVLLGVIANPNTVPQVLGGVKWMPVNLYVRGDTFYYVLYALLGRAIGMLETGKGRRGGLAFGVFMLCIVSISLGTRNMLHINGNFADTFYVYCGPLVFIAAISLLVAVKNCLNTRPLPGLGFISRHSLGIYGFHAFIIHFLRTNDYEITRYPVLDILWIFGVTLGGSLLLSMGLQRVDTHRLVS